MMDIERLARVAGSELLGVPPDKVEVSDVWLRQVKVVARQVLTEAAQACQAEVVDADATGSAEDEAYNRGCTDCSDAISALIPAAH